MSRDAQGSSIVPSGRQQRIFAVTLVAHVLAIGLPLTLGLLFMDQAEVFTINIVDAPSVGPEVGPITMRREPGEPDTPQGDPAPPVPVPPKPIAAKAEPNLVIPPKAKSEPVFDIPVPPKPKNVKPPREPKIVPPQPKNNSRDLPTKTAQKAADKPKTTTPPSKSGGKTGIVNPNGQGGKNTNELVPVGPKDVAQTYGKEFSNTPQGGRDKVTEYNKQLVAVLVMGWQPLAPPRSAMGMDAKPETRVRLTVSATGQVTGAAITGASGNAAMDHQVRIFLRELKQLPKPPDGKAFTFEFILDTAYSK